MDYHPVVWFHGTNFPAQRRRASGARELVGQPLRTEGSPAAQWAGGRAVALHAAVAIPRLGGHSPSRPVPVHTESKDIDDRPRRVGTNQPVHNHEDLLGVCRWLARGARPPRLPPEGVHPPGLSEGRAAVSHAAQRQLYQPARHGWPWPAAVPGETGRSMSGLGGHAQVDRGDGVSRRV